FNLNCFIFQSWDDGLAKVAKAWANKCKFEHNSCLSIPYGCYSNYKFVGENIWFGGLRIFSPKSAITAWFNETEFYDYDNLSCSKVCGHYTQVVWADSYKVGCAVTVCPGLEGYETAMFICNYAPAGNYQNRPPYTKGISCSLCAEEETCIKNLCGNKELDESESTYQTISILIQLLPPLETKWSFQLLCFIDRLFRLESTRDSTSTDIM
uniref:SCP domain-containing protein n=1 Tax=Mustela putorius furo TaxID=9669 RepID=M3Z1A6_MUSPF